MKKNEIEQLYCRHCGAKLIIKKRPQKGYEYDSKTGKPTGEIWVNARCPKKIWFMDKHTEYDNEPSYDGGML